MNPADVPVVRTERLTLRGPTRADVEGWARFIESSPDFLRFVPRSKVNRSPIERAERFAAGYLDRWQQEPGGLGWAAVDAEERLVGMAGVDAMSASEGELEYFVGEPFWRRGYGLELARAVVDHWFADPTRERLVAYVIPENAGSVRIVERLGFGYVRELDYLELAGSPDLVLETPIAAEFALTRDGYAARGSNASAETISRDAGAG
jgi:RimJ/RimL family protein N-acetyltransferase